MRFFGQMDDTMFFLDGCNPHIGLPFTHIVAERAVQKNNNARTAFVSIGS